MCKRKPERSEGAPSQKIGRELEASNIGPMCKRKPERSEGSGRNPDVFSISRNLLDPGFCPGDGLELFTRTYTSKY
ncbi:MAG: hypothetical protein ACLP2U_00050, partial [Syntrophobacteraceae bacterium]